MRKLKRIFFIVFLGILVCGILQQLYYKVNAERKSKVDDNTAKMQSIKWLGV